MKIVKVKELKPIARDVLQKIYITEVTYLLIR
jgi:hypothetical protein